jgi:hypothetical protein
VPDLQVSGEVYTRAAAEVRIRTILRGSPIGVELSGDEERFLRGLFARHPKATEKGEMRAFTVVASKFGNRCFAGVDAEGNVHEFSYVKCVRGK